MGKKKKGRKRNVRIMEGFEEDKEGWKKRRKKKRKNREGV